MNATGLIALYGGYTDSETKKGHDKVDVRWLEAVRRNPANFKISSAELKTRVNLSSANKQRDPRLLRCCGFGKSMLKNDVSCSPILPTSAFRCTSAMPLLLVPMTGSSTVASATTRRSTRIQQQMRLEKVLVQPIEERSSVFAGCIQDMGECSSSRYRSCLLL